MSARSIVKPKKSPAHAGDGTAGVDAFMGRLAHPLKSEIEAVRQIIRAAAPAITEEIKWNAPGFRTTESFATVNLRATDRLQLIFHLGAKVRKPSPELKITDPAGLMKWLAKDRALVTLGVGDEVRAHRVELTELVRAWITYL